MNQNTSAPDWRAVEQKFKRETKATLIQTMKELTAVSPQAHHFLHARYLHTKNIPARIKSYQLRRPFPFVPTVRRTIANCLWLAR